MRRIFLILAMSSTLGLVGSLAMAEDAPLPSSLPKPSPAWKIRPGVALGAPQPIQASVEAYQAENIRYFVSGGYFRYPWTARPSRLVQLASAEVGARYFPWNSWFFAGLGVGFRYTSVMADISSFSIGDQSVASAATLHLNDVFLSPVIGLNFRLGGSFALGCDLGAEIPIVPWGSLVIENAANGTNSSNSETLRVESGPAISRIAGLVLPRVTLFRLTWQFN
jgi:hypothetical protein